MSWPVFCYVDGIGLVNLQHVVRVECDPYDVPLLHMTNGEILVANGETVDGDELDKRINAAILDTAKTVGEGAAKAVEE